MKEILDKLKIEIHTMRASLEWYARRNDSKKSSIESKDQQIKRLVDIYNELDELYDKQFEATQFGSVMLHKIDEQINVGSNIKKVLIEVNLSELDGNIGLVSFNAYEL